MDHNIAPLPRKTVLLTAGRSPVCLDLARHLDKNGCRVLVADSMDAHVTGSSKAVDTSFVVRSPGADTAGFVQDIKRITQQQRVDTIVPIYEEGLLLSQEPALQPHLFTPSFEMQHALHNKWTFAQLQLASGQTPPKTWLLGAPSDVHQLDPAEDYALKACYSRASQQLHHLKPHAPLPSLDIDDDNPWIAQAWISGKHYCSYSVCEAGEVRAHVTYPVSYTVDGHSCVYFETTEHAGVEAWVRDFVGYHKLRGQLAFDFIEDTKGVLFAIECNPRPTSGVHLFPYDSKLGQTLFTAPKDGPLRPQGVRRQLFTGMMVYAWRQVWTKPSQWWGYVKALCTTRDALLAKDDPWPFFQQRVVARALRRLWTTYRLPLPSLFLREYQWDHRSYLREQREAQAAAATMKSAKVAKQA